MKPIIFISAVSEEFRGLRRDVADVLRTLGYEPHTQESLPTLEGDLRQALREQIDHCEGLIQIVGAGYGAEPPSIDADYGRVSYTQFEYLYARLKGKKLWVFFAADGDKVGRDKPLAQLDLPKPELAHPDPAAYQAERRELQQRYIAGLRSNGQVRHGFAGRLELLNQAHNLRDEFKALREQWEQVVGAINGIADNVSDIKQMVTVLLEERSRDRRSAVFNEEGGLERLQSALVEITKTREGIAALERFQQGEEREALAELDRLRAVQARSVADLALNALARGKIGFAEVIARFEEVTRLDGGQPRDWNILASLYKECGALADAERVVLATLDLAEAPEDQACALLVFSGIKQDQGDLVTALSSCLRCLALVSAEPSSAEVQRYLILSHEQIGDVRQAQGDLAAALDSYQRGLEIARRSVEADATNPQAQRVLLAILDMIGDVHQAQGDLLAAQASYLRGLEVAECLVEADSSSAEAQRDLSMSLDRVGEVQQAQGDLLSALASYRRSKEIRERLAEADPSSAQGQCDLSVSLNNIGDAQQAQGDMEAALESYRRGLVIAERQAEADPSSAEAQRDLSVSLNKIGDVQQTQGDLASALTSYRRMFAIAARLVEADPSSAQRRRGLSVSLDRIGEVQQVQGDLLSALASYRRGLEIRERLADADPSSAEGQRDLSVSHTKLGQVADALGDANMAREHWRAAHDILAAMDRRGMHLSPEDRRWLDQLRGKLESP